MSKICFIESWLCNTLTPRLLGREARNLVLEGNIEDIVKESIWRSNDENFPEHEKNIVEKKKLGDNVHWLGHLIIHTVATW